MTNKKLNYLEVGKQMAEVKGIYIRKLPVATADIVIMESVEVYVKELMELCSRRYLTKQEFITFIINAYEPRKISEQLDHFYDNSFKDFCVELKKQKVKLTASQQMELLPLFDERKKQISEISVHIKTIQTSLDDIIFSIYQIPLDISDMIKENTQFDL